MPGQHIWRIKVRKLGEADFEIAENRPDQWRGPEMDEVIDVIVHPEETAPRRKSVCAKIVSFHKSSADGTTTWEINAVEQDDGNPPGHREATEKDFQ